MKRENFQEALREINLAYLMLAQQMLKADPETACFRLGISEEVAQIISDLSVTGLVKMANSQTMLFRMSFDDATLARLKAGEGRDETIAGLHASILSASRIREALTNEA